MHILCYAIGLIVSFICGHATSLKVPVKEVYAVRNDVEKRELLAKRQAAAELDGVFRQHEKRITCLYDTWLMDLEMDREEADPFCSDFLEISAATATNTVVTKTTVFLIATTYQTEPGSTTTVAVSTVTATTSEIDMRQRALEKRQQSAATPVATIASLCSERPQDSSLISNVKSACSCLFLTTSTNIIPITVTSTRTIFGTDYFHKTVPVTVTVPVTTVVVTKKPSPVSSSLSYSGGLSIPTDTRGGASFNSTTVKPTSGSSTGTGSETSTPGTVSTSTETGTESSKSTTSTRLGTGSMGTSLSRYTGNVTITTGTGSGSSIVFTTSKTVSGSVTSLPPTPGSTGSSTGSYSGNLTIPTGTRAGGSLTSSYTFGPRTTSYPTTLTSILTSTSTGTASIPPSSVNLTSSAGTVISSGTSSIMIPPSNTTALSPTGTGYPPIEDCPFVNGTFYFTQCQEFQKLCYTNYGGPVNQGLIEPDWNDCIEGCAIANVGFSQIRCYAATYIPSAVGKNCFFKTLPSSRLPIPDSLAVSALFIKNGTCSDNTTMSSSLSVSTGFPTISSNRTTIPSPTGSPGFNISSRNGGATSTLTYPTSISSLSASTGFPISLNSSIFTWATGSSTAMASSSWPRPSNSSIFTGPTDFPTINISSRTGGPTSPISANSTLLPSVVPSVSVNTTSTSFGVTSAPNFTITAPTNTRVGSSLLSSNSANSSVWKCGWGSTSIVYSTIYTTMPLP